jgi:hypothetical protein
MVNLNRSPEKICSVGAGKEQIPFKQYALVLKEKISLLTRRTLVERVTSNTPLDEYKSIGAASGVSIADI